MARGTGRRARRPAEASPLVRAASLVQVLVSLGDSHEAGVCQRSSLSERTHGVIDAHHGVEVGTTSVRGGRGSIPP